MKDSMLVPVHESDCTAFARTAHLGDCGLKEPAVYPSGRILTAVVTPVARRP